MPRRHRGLRSTGCLALIAGHGTSLQACSAQPHQRLHQQQQHPRELQQASPRGGRRQAVLPRLQAAADNVSAAAASGASGELAGSVAADNLQEGLAGAGAWLDALYRFTRPHTMLGTAVSVCSVSALALGPGQLGSAAMLAGLQALSSALLMNICIVGINQVD